MTYVIGGNFESYTETPAEGPVFVPSQGSGGLFSPDIIGATPKYARNDGSGREPGHADSMARMYIRINPGELNRLIASTGDPQLRNVLPRLAGAARPGQDAVADTGYMDFFLQSVTRNFQEKVQVVETLADNYVAYFFGAAAPTFSFQGVLANTVQDDQATNWTRLYLALLRGTQLARRSLIVNIRYDSYTIAGAVTNFTDQLSSNNELQVPFSFQFLVKKLHFTNTTNDWQPTQPNGAFATDPRLVTFDGRDSTWRRPRRAVVQTPAPRPSVLDAIQSSLRNSPLAALFGSTTPAQGSGSPITRAQGTPSQPQSVFAPRAATTPESGGVRPGGTQPSNVSTPDRVDSRGRVSPGDSTVPNVFSGRGIFGASSLGGSGVFGL